MGSTWFNQNRADDEFTAQPEFSNRRFNNASADYPDYVPLSRRVG
jgi:hypothetical protein